MAKLRPIGFLADLHMASFRDFGGRFGEDGLNERGRICLDTLDRALARAKELGCHTVYFCGDVFDNRRPEPAIVAGVQRVLQCHDDLCILILPGNHDLFGVHAEAGNTAVEMLKPVAGVYRKPAFSGIFHDDPRDGEAFPIEPATFNVPFDGRKPMRDVIKDACKDAGLKGGLAGHVLVTHVGIVDDDSPPWLRDSADAMHVNDLMATLTAWDMPAAFVGNYHEHRQWSAAGWKRDIVQIGALCPTGFDNPGLENYGGLAIWDGERVHWESIPGPRFVKVPPKTFPPDKPPGCRVFVRAERPDYCHQGDTEETNDNTQYYDGYESVEAAPAPLEQADLAKPAQLLEGAEDAVREYCKVAKFSQDVVDKALSYWRRA